MPASLRRHTCGERCSRWAHPEAPLLCRSVKNNTASRRACSSTNGYHLTSGAETVIRGPGTRGDIDGSGCHANSAASYPPRKRGAVNGTFCWELHTSTSRVVCITYWYRISGFLRCFAVTCLHERGRRVRLSSHTGTCLRTSSSGFGYDTSHKSGPVVFALIA